MSIYNSQLVNLRRRIDQVEQSAKGAQGSFQVQELCAICKTLLDMVSDLASKPR